MQMHQIRYFLAAARLLNFTQAATECNVSQPALSRAIKQLEEELGGDLFRRERSLSHLTDLGRMMVPLLTQAYETASSAKALACSFREGNRTPLRLGLSKATDLRLFIDALTQLIETLPGVQFEFMRDDREAVEEALKKGDVELVVAGPLTSTWDRLRSWPLFSVPYRLVMSREHTLASQDRVTLRQLREERLISRPYCDMARTMAEYFSEQGMAGNAHDVLASEDDVLRLIEINLGVAIMPATTVLSDTLIAISIDGFDIECPVHLYAVAGREYSPAASGLIQLLRAANWNEQIAGLTARPQ